jgi:glycosyltransferase involved in cell wall biosynthesis
MIVTLTTSINPWYSSTAGSNRLLSLAIGLSKYCEKVNLIIYEPYQNEKEKEEWSLEGNHNGIFYQYASPRVVDGYLNIRFYKYLGRFLDQLKLFKKIIAECRYVDIIWLDSSIFSLQLAQELRRKYPKKDLFIEQSEFLDIFLYNKGNFLHRFDGNRRKKLFEKKVFPILDGLALMTRTLHKHYENFSNPRPRMLHLPMTVNLERFENIKPMPEEFRQPYIAFVGVMNDAKDGVSNLIKAFNLIKNQFLEYKVYLVGAWNYDTPIHLELIKSFRLEDRVFWMKEYSRDAIPSIIGNADLLVLPRPDSKQAQGGFPTKLGEYLATGNPVCATSVGEIPDYLTDNESVFFAQPGSVESFAEAMRRALSDPENAKRVGLNGKKVAQKEFNKDIQAKKLHQFLLELQDKKND